MKSLGLLGMLLGLILAVALRAGLAQQKVELLPADLALVPGDATLFLHVRVADLWKSHPFKEVRDLALKADPKAIKQFTDRFVPVPGLIERFTLIAYPEKGLSSPSYVALVRTTKELDQEDLIKTNLPEAGASRAANKITYYVDEEKNVAMFFPDAQTVAYGPTSAVEHLIKQSKKETGSLAQAVRLAQTGKALVVHGHVPTLLKAIPWKAPPKQVLPFLKAESATLSLDLAENGHLKAQLSFVNATELKSAEESLKELVRIVQTELESEKDNITYRLGQGEGNRPLEDLPHAAFDLLGLGALSEAEELLKTIWIQGEKEQLSVAVGLPQKLFPLLTATVMTARFFPDNTEPVTYVEKHRLDSQENLKQIGLAFHNYESAYATVPTIAMKNNNGKSGLSWRVAILPYIEETDLYREFKLDEPWDSEHNKKLIPRIPKIYKHPGIRSAKEGHTHYRLFQGKDAVFHLTNAKRFTDITDGMSNTVLVVESSKSEIWTKPEELDLDKIKEIKPLLLSCKDQYQFLMFDGSTKIVHKNIREQTLRNAILPSDGSILGDDWEKE